MTDTTEKQPESESSSTASAKLDGVLKAFMRKAEAALERFGAATQEVERRLTERVESRVKEQSRAMSATESDVAALRVGLAEQTLRLDTLAQSVAKLDAAVKETKRRMGEQGEAVKKVLETCRQIDAKAGERFGAKVEALGSQVAKLAMMGSRLEAAELRSKGCEQACAELSRRLVASDDLTDSLRSDLAALRSVVEQIQLPKAEKPKAKAAEAKVS